jgi:hypothetical protein
VGTALKENSAGLSLVRGADGSVAAASDSAAGACAAVAGATSAEGSAGSTGGPAGVTTFTKTLRSIDPPGPVHVKVYVAEAVSAGVSNRPVGGWAPVQSPDATQVSAFKLAHDKRADTPAGTSLGSAPNDRNAGVSAANTVANDNEAAMTHTIERMTVLLVHGHEPAFPHAFVPSRR